MYQGKIIFNQSNLNKLKNENKELNKRIGDNNKQFNQSIKEYDLQLNDYKNQILELKNNFNIEKKVLESKMNIINENSEIKKEIIVLKNNLKIYNQIENRIKLFINELKSKFNFIQENISNLTIEM